MPRSFRFEPVKAGSHHPPKPGDVTQVPSAEPPPSAKGLHYGKKFAKTAEQYESKKKRRRPKPMDAPIGAIPFYGETQGAPAPTQRAELGFRLLWADARRALFF